MRSSRLFVEINAKTLVDINRRIAPLPAPIPTPPSPLITVPLYATASTSLFPFVDIPFQLRGSVSPCVVFRFPCIPPPISWLQHFPGKPLLCLSAWPYLEQEEDAGEEKGPQELANFGLSGKLAKDQSTGNVYKGVVLKV